MFYSGQKKHALAWSLQFRYTPPVEENCSLREGAKLGVGVQPAPWTRRTHQQFIGWQQVKDPMVSVFSESGTG
jgi:hypothetical protein